MDVTIDDIITQFGAYYINEGQNKNKLLTLLKQKTVTPSYARSIVTENTLYRFANTYFGEILQSFQKGFTPKGSAEFKPNEIKLRNMKIDLEIWPDDIVESWLGFLSDKDTDDRAKWPLVRYIMEMYVKPQVDDDLETIVYGTGEYLAPTVGTAGDAINACDGLIKLVTDGIANVDQPMNAVAGLDPFDETNSFEQMEALVDNIPQVMKKVKTDLLVDPQIEINYWRDKRNTHGTDSNYNDAKAKVLDFMPNVRLVGLPSLAGTGAVLGTPVGNFLHVRRKNGYNAPTIDKKDLRCVQIGLDWWEALGFGYNELVWAYLPPVTP